jgi:hypothetical protein
MLGDPNWVPFSFAIFLAAPALRASGNWSQLFHFDLARLSDGPWRKVRASFVQKGKLWSLIPSTYAWFWASLWIAFFMKRDHGVDVIAYLLALCWIQGALAWVSLENFTARRGERAFTVALLSASFLILPRIVPEASNPLLILLLVFLHRFIPWIAFQLLPYRNPEASVRKGRVSQETFQHSSDADSTEAEFSFTSRLRFKTRTQEIDRKLADFLPGVWSKTQEGKYTIRLPKDSARSTLQSLAGAIAEWTPIPAQTLTPSATPALSLPELKSVEDIRRVLPSDAWIAEVSGNPVWESSLEPHQRRYLFRALEREREKVVKIKGWNIYPLWQKDAEVEALIGVPRRKRTEAEQALISRFLKEISV